MKLIKHYSIPLAALIIAACSAPKKTITSKAPVAPVTAKAPATTAKSTTGIFAPGAEELAAIQVKYKEVTMQTLTDGYAIYTGVCTNCHRAKNIYNRPEEIWPGIMDDMALKAKITDAQKGAVYKYVLAIKSTQPKDIEAPQNKFLYNYGIDSTKK